MPKPNVVSVPGVYKITYTLEDDSKIQIVNLKGGKSYQTIDFPKGTVVEITLSKLPIEEEKDASL